MKIFLKTFGMLLFFVVATATIQSKTANAASENLIPNPLLETPSADPSLPQGWYKGGWGTNTRQFTYPVNGHTLVLPSSAIKVEITNYTSGDAKWYFQEIPVTAGKTYTYSNWYQSNIPSLSSIRFTHSDGSTSYIDVSLNIPPSTAWANVNKTFTVPNGAVSMTVFHVIKQVGYLVTDNFSLVEHSDSNNLIKNSDFSEVSANGEVAFWHKGGYGENSRGHGVVECKFYAESDPSFRPACPANTRRVLRVMIGDYISGDAKWYFEDVAIAPNKDFKITFDYQPYSYTAQAIARYLMKDGNYKYELISHLPPLVGGAMGYVGWSKADYNFTPPADSISLTVFFAINRTDLSCPFVMCYSGDRGTLSIANPTLVRVAPANPEAVNILTNPSLENTGSDNMPTSWLKGGWGTNSRTFTYTNSGFNSAHGARVDISNYVNGDAKWYFADVQVTGGKTYTLHNSYKSNVNTETVARYETPTGYKYAMIGSSTPSADWNMTGRTFTVPADATKMTVFHLISSNGYLEVDEFALYQIN